MEGFATPIANKFVSRLKEDKSVGSPVTIPDSPHMNLLGMGTGVKVYSFERSSHIGSKRSPWAVKRVSKHALSESVYQSRLSAEADILRRLKHPNVIGFRAYVPGKDGRLCLAMEECEISLNDLIEARSDKCYGPFPAEPILRVAVDISKALDYLHTEARIMHGDVKSNNVLIKGDFEIAKLCDFGVCIRVDANGMMDAAAPGANMGYVGTECWKAPELVDEDNCIVSTKADIFAYGLTLWEMLSLSVPHMDDLDADISSDMTDVSFSEESFLAKIENTSRILQENLGPGITSFAN
ncbi:lymphokine-activated killer T-cell-originated protein kinase isoform X2 [Anabrus simplex]|uniref:lymphokine-activated killer T-cell-originated protein kinase isoform X2 n=1 Tax=Anabrus simplex TaxID=316456 RepID=UPI0035A39C6A